MNWSSDLHELVGQARLYYNYVSLRICHCLSIPSHMSVFWVRRIYVYIYTSGGVAFWF